MKFTYKEKEYSVGEKIEFEYVRTTDYVLGIKEKLPCVGEIFFEEYEDGEGNWNLGLIVKFNYVFKYKDYPTKIVEHMETFPDFIFMLENQ